MCSNSCWLFSSSAYVTGHALRDLLKESCKSFIAPTVLTTKSPPLNSKQVLLLDFITSQTLLVTIC